MSGGGYGSMGSSGNVSGSTAQPFSAFGQAKSFGGAPTFNPNAGGSMGNFNPNAPGFNPNAGGNFDPTNSGYSTGLWNPQPQQAAPLNALPNQPNSSYQPYMGAPDLTQFNLSQPYIDRTVQEANNPDQQSLQAFNAAQGTNYQSLTQIPASDWQNYQATSGQQGNPQPKGVVISENPFSRTGVQNATAPGYLPGPTAQFTPPAYPSWLYGPTAGLFGGVTKPQGTPQNYGYFPGTGQWGAQPNGSNFT